MDGGILGEVPAQTPAVSNQTQDVSIILPLGWQEILHTSGIKCYFHEESGVVTWSKPYAVKKEPSFDGNLLEYVSKKHMPPLTIFQPQSLPADDDNLVCHLNYLLRVSIVRD